MANQRCGNRLMVTALALALIFLLFEISNASEPIKIGVVGVHSGELAPYGISGLRGVELAVRQINAQGGVLGRTLESIVEDDLCKPKEAAIIASKLVVRDVPAVIGHICSGATLAALEIYSEARVVVISPSATNPALTRSGRYPNFFRTIAPDDKQARVQVDFTLDVLKKKHVAVLHDKGVYGKGLAEFVKTNLRKSDRGRLVLYEGLPPAMIDYSMLAKKIRRSKADAVIFGGYHPAATKLLTHMRKMKLTAVFVSGDGVKDQTFIEMAGKYAEGVYATAPKDTSRIPLAVAATKAHYKEYGETPGSFFLTAHAATLALANAIKKVGSTDHADVSSALKTEYVETPLGNIIFDEHGDVVGVSFTVYQVQNGRFVELK
ncbi:Branched-chain amino acid ABC transporter, substrate-binding protein LivJ (TC 3.A.1.4.1) [Olavius algarvensis associated proteobacterium Delta 3]|nr:Branched-chain amino acid ABC transporter, substrate-binding protein LivJ (TC 3.A.1.4.1) [Olavius algarvensis associated proteobacterium Delta 3]CAB5165114.1 Branched-chain amino acid ABC transporter, substrate-binding protein LivJ (TC 3.A.1.4.1) [Olavius algarvensis associated proteobacterium Delta 3]